MELNFDDITVSTKTIIGVSDLKIDIETVFKNLEISPYVVIPKKRGRQKKVSRKDPNKDLPEGSIITLKYQGNVRGVDLQANKHKKKRSLNAKKYFRNALTVVMKIDNKLINFKISKNGKFQITGVKFDNQAKKCVQFFWEKLDTPEQTMKIIFINVMTNIDFNVGFIINRENLDRHMNSCTEYHSLLETSFGYTGVNIKIPLTEKIEIDLDTMFWENHAWNYGTVKYTDYISGLSLEDQQKEKKKKRYNTFLVFHSGKIIMSGMNQKFMKPVFNQFVQIIRDSRDIIEERLEE